MEVLLVNLSSNSPVCQQIRKKQPYIYAHHLGAIWLLCPAVSGEDDCVADVNREFTQNQWNNEEWHELPKTSKHMVIPLLAAPNNFSRFSRPEQCDITLFQLQS
jgi:hypothetical protein